MPAVDAPEAGDDAVARDDLLVHAEVAAAMGDELVDFFECAGVEQQVDALARRQLAGFALPPQPILAATQLGAAFEIGEVSSGFISRRQAFTACAFSQSFRNFSRPMSVSGCLKHCSITAGGQVTTSAPIRAASMT